MSDTLSILELTPDDLRRQMEAMGAPAFRADQVADWVYKKAVADPAAMTNLPKDLQAALRVFTSRVAARADSEDGTFKLLLEYADGQRVETVLIPTPDRATACLSTQIGCGMECTFCASGQGGLVRNLSGGEILQQVLHLQQASGRRVTHAVFMGSGEPLANYDATVAAVRALIDPARFGISARHITVSTVGLPKMIRRLAGEDLPITLAISLHAPNDALRRQIMPTAAGAPIDAIVEAADEFFHSRNRELTLEYALLAGVNDTNVCAEGLARIASRLRCNVNLIRYNPSPSLPYQRPTDAAVAAFVQRLRRRGVNVQVRRSRGADVAAACGQLRAADEDKP
jgi:23S rRNA (adenine2503-C2)-methyltransferase